MAKNQKDDIELFHDTGIHVPTRTIYIGSESSSDANAEGNGESGVDHVMAERVIKNLHLLDTLNSENITILMNNIGGDEFHCFAIYDAIKACKSHVTIKIFGHAMSAGSLILQAADHRVMMPSSVQMIHYGTWGVHDHAKTTQKWAKEGQRIDEWMENLYLEKIREKHPDFKLKKLREMLMTDTFFTAKDSVKYGLADEVFDGSKKEE